MIDNKDDKNVIKKLNKLKKSSHWFNFLFVLISFIFYIQFLLFMPEYLIIWFQKYDNISVCYELKKQASLINHHTPQTFIYTIRSD